MNTKLIKDYNRDFNRINEIIERALKTTDISKEKSRYREALKEIRGIVYASD